MRQYYMVFGILLIFSIIDFAVAAPVRIQRKPRSDVYVVHTTEHAKTRLGKRGGELDDLVFKAIGYPESHSPARPEEPPALRPSGPTDVPSTPNEPSQVANPGHAPPVPYNDELNNLWFKSYFHHLSDDSLAAHPSWGSPSSGSPSSRPDPGLEGVEQPVPSIPNEPSQVTSPGRAPPVPGNGASNNLIFDLDDLLQVGSPSHVLPVPGNDALNNLWFEAYGYRHPDDPLAAHPSSGSPSSGPAPGLEGVEQPAPSIPNEPSQVASPGHAPPVPGDDALNNLWFEPYGHRHPDDPLAAHPSWGSPSSGPAPDLAGDEQPVPPIPNEPSHVASPGHASPVPGNDALNNLQFGSYGDSFPDAEYVQYPW